MKQTELYYPKNPVYQVTIFRTFLIQAINTQLENNPLEFKNHQW